MSKREQARMVGRMKDPADSDPSVRRLRRRYDQLREDYEVLLDRLADLEERLAEQDTPGAEAPATNAEDRWPGGSPTGNLVELIPQLVAPLIRLREEYEATLGGLQHIVEGLNTLATGAMKGQRGSSHSAPAAGPVPPAEPGRPRQLQVEVRGKGFGELLDFQERISSIEGVSRVTIHGIDSERATFIVELTS